MPPSLTLAEARELVTEAQRLIDAIEAWNIANFRDRALLALIGYANASFEGIIGMAVQDYYSWHSRHWVRLVENGIERHQLVNRKLKRYLDDYLEFAKIGNQPQTPLFRQTYARGQRLSTRSIDRTQIARLSRYATTSDDGVSPRKTGLQLILKSIRGYRLNDLRDRAIVGILRYASVSAETIARMRVSDYYQENDQRLLRITRERSQLAAPPLVALMERYLAAVRWRMHGSSFLFRADGTRSMAPSDIRKMIENRRLHMIRTIEPRAAVSTSRTRLRAANAE